MIKIVSDTACDLPASMVEEYGITIVPLHIHFGNERYQEGVNLDWDLFYRKIDESGIIATTSVPSVGEFVEVYRELAQEEDVEAILSMHLTSKLSGVYQSAHIASQQVADEVRVYPYDTLAGSAATGLMLLEAAEMARAGKGPEEIISRLDEIRPRANILIVVETLEYARKSGRVGGLSAALASLLNVKPIIHLQDGLLDVGEKVRSRKKALDRVLDIVEERVGTTAPVNLAVVHARDLEVARQMLSRAEERFNCQRTYLHDICATLVVHFGPGTIGVCFYAV